MFTLSEASAQVKKFMVLGGLFIGLLIIAFILIRIFVIVKNIIAPPPPPTATSAFGTLPMQVFPQNATSKNLTYSINTLSGYLPTLSTVMNVYRMQAIVPNLLSFNKLQSEVSSIGFPTTYTTISDVVFEWQRQNEGVNLSLKGNSLTGNFNITSDYTSNADVLARVRVPAPDQAAQIAATMLDTMGLVSNDLDQNNIKTKLFSIVNGNLVPASSQSTAQVIRVDYYQKDIDKIPIYYEKPDTPNINIFVSGGATGPQVVAVNFIHQAPTQESATYSLKTTAQAFEDLKQGKGYIASYNGNSNNVSVNNVFLAYYISSQQQDFLMPIFVFTGDNNFYAYVPAVTDGSIGN